MIKNLKLIALIIGFFLTFSGLILGNEIEWAVGMLIMAGFIFQIKEKPTIKKVKNPLQQIDSTHFRGKRCGGNN